MAWAIGSQPPMPSRMPFRLNLRSRVVLGFALLGAGICLGMTVGLDFATDDLERRLLEDTMSTELQETEEQFDLEPSGPLPATATIHSYTLPETESGPVPSELCGLTPGFHEVAIGGREFAVAVSRRDERRFFVLYDRTALSRHEGRLHLFLAAGIAIMALLSAVGGRWLAAKVIAPVTVLARRVAALPPGERVPSLAQGFADDEVGELARAVDGYTERLAEAMEREQSFTGDVSHELRNPLAVAQGAVDVLREMPGLPDSARRPLERIARATALMEEIGNALLSLARTAGGTPEAALPFAVEDLVRELMESYRGMLRGKPVAMELRIEGPLTVVGERASLRILLGNLIRNACYHTRRGHIRIAIGPRGVAVEDTGVGLDSAQLAGALHRGYRDPASPGAGIGLSLTRRLCERNGWRLNLDSERGRGTRVWVGLGEPRA
jgi:signal transduction histidine kinase